MRINDPIFSAASFALPRSTSAMGFGQKVHTMMSARIAVAALACALSGRAAAQTCVGIGGFSAGAEHVGASAATAQFYNTWVDSYDATLMAGRDVGWFAGIGAGTMRWPRDQIHAWRGDALAGFAMPLGSSRALLLCPMVGASRQQWGGVAGVYSDASGTHTIHDDVNIDRLSAGASLGLAIPFGTTLTIAPFAGASLVARHSARDVTISPGSTSLPNVHHDDRVGVVRLGAGLIVLGRVTIRPHVDLPLGASTANEAFAFFDSHTAYALDITLALGRRTTDSR